MTDDIFVNLKGNEDHQEKTLGEFVKHFVYKWKKFELLIIDGDQS